MYADQKGCGHTGQKAQGLRRENGRSPGDDAQRIVEAFKDKKPDEWFVADPSGVFTVEGASRILRLLPVGLDFSFEAPCQTWRECLSLRRRTNVPTIHDELALPETYMIQMVADDVCEGINFKVQKFGGFTKARRVRDLCIAAGYVMSVQETCGPDIGIGPLVHLAKTIPEKFLRCVLAGRDMLSVTTADGPLHIVDWRITAPTVPGLGIAARMVVLEEPVARYF